MRSKYTGRQIAVFSDAHGLLEPLVSTLEDIKKRGITEIYSLGDNIGVGPNSGEVLDLLKKYNVNCINGNSEEYCILGIEPFKVYFGEKKTKNQEWTMSTLTKKQVESLKKNKHSYDLLVGGKKIGLCHFINDVRFDYNTNSVWNYQKAIKENDPNPQKQFYNANTPEQLELLKSKSKSKLKEDRGYVSAYNDPVLGGKKVDYYDEIIQGHAHFKYYTEDKNVKVRSIRALALAYEDNPYDLAYYIIIKEKNNGYDIEEVYVPYDRKKMLKSIDDHDIPDKSVISLYTYKDVENK
ncbi:MAG: metallophosphoesterase family protein [Bacilli bacterium]|nr:metallophosphoesterase family protein [Bacilli bacterium]